MLLQLIVAIILAYQPALRQADCTEGDTRCLQRNEQKAQTVNSLAQAILTESARQTLDPIMVTSVVNKESSFLSEPCQREMDLEDVVTREPLGGDDGYERITYQCPTYAHPSLRRDDNLCAREAWEVRTEGDKLMYSTCSAGEVGYMQILYRSRWARAGTTVPGTDEQLSRDGRERRRQMMTARINVALGCQEMADFRTNTNHTLEDPWWHWIGAYNTGNLGSGARRYANRILRQYDNICQLQVTLEDGSTVQVKDANPNCAEVTAELERRRRSGRDEE